ncbi:DUF6153 family protein [Streptomyces sp. NPDC057445]|uniref:DUF6153 family protein n=1 Tax=Streptomyces sp. NPDC057445 TaxID=3346136 RepID=UPI003673F4E6
MTSSTQPTSRRPAGRGTLLLVLAVLAGVLAMHGLAPGHVTTAHADAHGRHGALMAQDASGHQPGQECAHAVEGGADGHTNHADATCAAGGVTTSYAPPAPAPALAASAPALVPPGRVAAATERGRAPPNLAQLQLLRI